MVTVAVSWPATLSILAGLVSIALARWIWNFRGRPGATYWTANQVIIGIWALLYGVALLVFDPALRQLFDPLLWFTRAMSPPLILLFAFAYTGRDSLARPRVAAGLFGYWLFIVSFYFTNHLHYLAWTEYQIEPVFGAAAASFRPQILLYVATASAYLSIGVAAALILGPLLTYRRLFGQQAAAIAVVLLFPTIANVVWLFRLGPTGHLDLTPIMFLVSTAGMSYALFREELFEFLPATTRVGTRTAISDINLAVLTVSPTGRLVDFNPAGASLFDLERPTALGQPVRDVISGEVPLEETQTTVSNPGGQQGEFDVEVSHIESNADNLAGYVVTFYDITTERRRQQRLAVQSRILRHNLRNELTIVRGNAARIAAQVSEEQVRQRVEKIQDASESLVDASTKVREFDQALSVEPRAVDVAQLCRTVVEEIRDRYPTAELTVTTGSTASLDVRERVLRQILEEVIENGIVHADTETPAVEVEVSSRSSDVVITIEDEGPGIPEGELEALQRSEEGPLSHGSSIGLWVVQWGTTVLGGGVTFDSEPSGTTVTIALPDE